MTTPAQVSPTPCAGVHQLNIVGIAWGDEMSLKIKRARKTVALCLDLDLVAEHERAVDALNRARRESKRDDREASPEVRDAAAAVVALEQRMRESTVSVALEARPRKEWAEFEEANPPREGAQNDEAFQIHIPALDPMIGESIVEARDHEGDVVELDWADITDDLSSGQWQEFALALLKVNRGETESPFSMAASAVMRSSDAT